MITLRMKHSILRAILHYS